jgi:histidine triad (HIT) family protein
MKDCLFCKIIRREIPCHKVYEDDLVISFLDIKPHAMGHTVVIPKVHAERVFDLKEDVLKELIIAVRKTMNLLQEKLNPDGFNVGWNDGAAAGQVVKHLHVHIMPRWERDGGGSQHTIINNAGNRSVEEVAEMFNEN